MSGFGAVPMILDYPDPCATFVVKNEGIGGATIVAFGQRGGTVLHKDESPQYPYSKLDAAGTIHRSDPRAESGCEPLFVRLDKGSQSSRDPKQSGKISHKRIPVNGDPISSVQELKTGNSARNTIQSFDIDFHAPCQTELVIEYSVLWPNKTPVWVRATVTSVSLVSPSVWAHVANLKCQLYAKGKTSGAMMRFRITQALTQPHVWDLDAYLTPESSGFWTVPMSGLTPAPRRQTHSAPLQRPQYANPLRRSIHMKLNGTSFEFKSKSMVNAVAARDAAPAPRPLPDGHTVGVVLAATCGYIRDVEAGRRGVALGPAPHGVLPTEPYEGEVGLWPAGGGAGACPGAEAESDPGAGVASTAAAKGPGAEHGAPRAASRGPEFAFLEVAASHRLQQPPRVRLIAAGGNATPARSIWQYLQTNGYPVDTSLPAEPASSTSPSSPPKVPPTAGPYVPPCAHAAFAPGTHPQPPLSHPHGHEREARPPGAAGGPAGGRHGRHVAPGASAGGVAECDATVSAQAGDQRTPMRRRGVPKASDVSLGLDVSSSDGGSHSDCDNDGGDGDGDGGEAATTGGRRVGRGPYIGMHSDHRWAVECRDDDLQSHADAAAPQSFGGTTITERTMANHYACAHGESWGLGGLDGEIPYAVGDSPGALPRGPAPLAPPMAALLPLLPPLLDGHVSPTVDPPLSRAAACPVGAQGSSHEPFASAKRPRAHDANVAVGYNQWKRS